MLFEMDGNIWPCRGVAEHAYCPRLFYYMTVEGVFIPSSDTEQGAGVHKRVDRPSAAPVEPSKSAKTSDHPATEKIEQSEVDPDRPRSIRSLALTSDRLGITATLDLAEIEGNRAVPIEYRKGRPKHTGMPSAEPIDDMMEEPRLIPLPEPWPTDRVQLGLQVALLEEAGYTVPEAYLYYAAEKLKLRVVVDESLRNDALAELEAAKRAAAGPRPAPLVNDPRCPRCSLQPICLPDEINHQRFTAPIVEGSAAADGKGSASPSADDLTPRKLWPPRDDGIHVVLQREGVKVGVRGQSVRVTDKDGQLVRDLPLANLESLALLGSVQVSTQALVVFADQEVPVAFLSAAGRLTAMMDPMGPTSAAVRVAQVRTLDRPEKALELARAITIAKIANQRTLLMRNHADLRVAALRALNWVPQPASQRVLDGASPVSHRKQSLRVDEIMFETVRNIRLALFNHGDAAKIAFGFTSDYKPMPGDRKYWFNKTQDNDGEPTRDVEKKAAERAQKHTEYLQDTLMLWHDLAVSAKWRDDKALSWWNDDRTGILPWIKSAPFTPPSTNDEDRKDKKKVASHDARTKHWKELWEQLQTQPLARRVEEAEENADRAQRNANREAIRALLAPVAERLRGDRAMRQRLSENWTSKWKPADGDYAIVPKVERGTKGPCRTTTSDDATGFHAHLRLITDWIMGRRLPGATNHSWRQNVGGLSLTRIATMKSLYQLQKAFAMRATPAKPRGAPEKGETNAGVAQSILNAMEKMREQRVKQLSSRIAASALGLGGHWRQIEGSDGKPLMKSDGSPRWKWVEEPSPKYSPCHAVVIENLTNYRPEETRTRRENRQLMAWSSSKVKKYLGEACQLHGLHLREVQANYTSRQDSRTGAPGIRCSAVSAADFLNKPWWRRAVKIAEKKIGETKGDARDRYLKRLNDQLNAPKQQDKPLPQSVLVPVNGGELFVSADAQSPAVQGLQADLNAAANIGLKALIDPDWPGKWWYVPCDSSTYNPHPEKTKGSHAIKNDRLLIPSKQPDPEAADSKSAKKVMQSKSVKRQREIVNLWRDISAASIDASGSWQVASMYWNDVRCRVLDSIGKTNEITLRLPVESPATPW